MTDVLTGGSSPEKITEALPIVMVMPNCLERGCKPLELAVKSALESMAANPQNIKLVSCIGSTAALQISRRGLERKETCGVKTREMSTDHYVQTGIEYGYRETPMDLAEERGAVMLSPSQINQIANSKN